MPVAEAFKLFKEGAVVMKRKGAVEKIDVKDSWYRFGGLNDQKRFLVGQIDNPSRFLLYYASKDAVKSGQDPRGWFSLDELKLAVYSFRMMEIGVFSDLKQGVPIMKKLSKIPDKFFIALIVCIRHAIGAEVRRNNGVVPTAGLSRSITQAKPIFSRSKTNFEGL